MNYLKEEMIKIGADGVIFHSLFTEGLDVLKHSHREYTFDEINSDTVKFIPRSARTYYKLVDGKKVLYDLETQKYME